MTKTRSFRTTAALDDFIDRTDMELSSFARRALTRERIRQAEGVCATCGRVIYTGLGPEYDDGDEFATYTWTSVGGQKLDLDHGEQVSLCGTHADAFQQAYRAEVEGDDADPNLDPEYPALTYVDRIYKGDVQAYMLEARAVRAATPDRDYAEPLITARDDDGDADTMGYLETISQCVAAWLDDSDAPGNVATDEFDPQTVFETTDAIPALLRDAAQSDDQQ